MWTRSAGPGTGLDGGAEAIDRVRAHENLGNTVYLAICDGLTKGQFKPGDPVRIRALAELLGTSVTPVRDAVLRLVHDKALIMKTARDIRVPMLSPSEYQEIREIRLSLEALAAAKAAEMATAKDIELVAGILEDNESAIRSGQYTRATELNQVFHFTLTDIAGMPTLKGVLSRLWLRMGPIIAASYEAGGRTMIDTHYDVLKALEAGDGKAAAEAIQRDIVIGGEAILEQIAADDTAFSPPAYANRGAR